MTPEARTGSGIDLDLPRATRGDRLVITVFSDPVSSRVEELGRWVFCEPAGGAATVFLDWSAPGAEMLSLASSEGTAPSLVESSREDGVPVRPRMLVEVRCGGERLEFPIQVTDTRALEEYYASESHQDAYVVEHPFFHSFHQARLRTMGKLFRKHIPPGSRVLDVGSGYSIFFLITTDWDYEITCCDLDAAAMEKMRGLVPNWRWLVSDAVTLPFEDGSFDSVYAGEIIEHVPEAASALSEWTRVLKGGGTLILTTPNRDRLLARANRRAAPVHPEHVREFTLGELRGMLAADDLVVVSATGIYLEWMLNWYRPAGLRVDMLVSLFSRPVYSPIYRASMWMGRLAPGRAFDLVMVCRKK
ncbi:MAG: class I SAM-dependent methyltransferase [Actinomycetota bacterium]